MRISDNNLSRNESNKEIHGVDLHDSIPKETNPVAELSTGFGMSTNDIKKLKRQMNRS